MSSKKIHAEPSCSNKDNTLKRRNAEEVSDNKRLKLESNETENIEALKTKNLNIACEQVSYLAYLNYSKRFKLVYLPICINMISCSHEDGNHDINSIPSHVEQSFNIEIKTNMWHDALEVCFLSLTPNQYLTASVLKNITEIMLNAHENPDAEFTTSHLIEKCQQILSQSFSTHPPCNMKRIRKCYNDFLTSPMDLKKNTFTNRSEFDYEKGIVKYCMKRLEYEISLDSKDEPLVNKYDKVPNEMKKSVKGLHWQKAKCEIFEALDRNVRIKRLFAVLESVIELLQFDLAIWNARHDYRTGSQIKRSQKPLMAFVLWSDDTYSTGTVSNDCRRILKIFVYLVHLQYPEENLKIITIWLNSIIQTFYMFENNCNSDYPNTGKYCYALASELYRIIQVLPEESIYRILKRIQPPFMQHLVGCMHIKVLLSTNEDDIIKITNNFIKQSKWKFLQKTENSNEALILIDNYWKVKEIKNVSNYLSKIIKKKFKSVCIQNNSQELYPKFDYRVFKYYLTRDQFSVISTLYITLKAYLEAFSVQDVQGTLDTLNKQMLNVENMAVDEYGIPEHSSYTVTENFIQKYRYTYEMLQDLISTLHILKSNKQFPELLKIFENISLLKLQIKNFSFRN